MLWMAANCYSPDMWHATCMTYEHCWLAWPVNTADLWPAWHVNTADLRPAWPVNTAHLWPVWPVNTADLWTQLTCDLHDLWTQLTCGLPDLWAQLTCEHCWPVNTADLWPAWPTWERSGIKFEGLSDGPHEELLSHLQAAHVLVTPRRQVQFSWSTCRHTHTYTRGKFGYLGLCWMFNYINYFN